MKKLLQSSSLLNTAESIINVLEVHQWSFGDVEKFRFLVANKNVC